MSWIKLKDQKPKPFQQCWVMNIKRYSYQYHALYYELDDTFRLILKDTHDYPLNITHWFAMPEYMSVHDEQLKELEAEMGCKVVHSNSCWYIFENGQTKRTECQCDKDADLLKLAQDEYEKWKENNP